MLVVHHFFAVWVAVLVPFLWVAWRVGEKRPVAPPRWPQPRLGTRDWAAIGAFAACLALYVGVILWAEDFADYDSSMFIVTTLRGFSHGRPIWPGQGRFFPLGHQEFNLVRHFTRSIYGYFAIGVVELALTIAGTLLLLREYSLQMRLAIVGTLLLAPGFFVSFSGLVYPERNVVFLLVGFLVCVRAYDKTRSAWSLLGALCLLHACLYFKEAVFAFALGFAVARLAIARGRLGRAQVLDLCVCGLALGFLALYAVAMGGRPNLNYATMMQHGPTALSVAWRYASTDLRLVAFVGVALARGAYLWRARKPPDPFWDPVASGALGYAAVFCYLKLFAAWYSAPVDVLGTLYLAWLSRPLWTQRTPARLALGAAAGFACLQGLALISYREVEHKALILSRSKLATFLESQGGTGTVDVFSPYAAPYVLMEVGAYLEHRGIRIPGDQLQPPGSGPSVRLEGLGPFPRGLCQDYRPIPCVEAEAPPPASFVVLLPDDIPQGARPPGDVLYHWAMLGPEIGRLLAPFHALSMHFSQMPVPPSWLELTILRSPPASEAAAH
jgi:hypothetical protein